MATYRTNGESKGIYCLETNWFGDRDRTTVEPALSLLHRKRGVKVPYLHFFVATKQEFEYRLKKWALKEFSGYPILYLGFHGDAGEISLDDGSKVDLEYLSEILGSTCQSRVVHFGSCLTMDVDENRLNDFKTQTRALAVLGYKETVDWITSMAFEILLLGQLQFVSFTWNGMRSADIELGKIASSLRCHLKFRMHYRSVQRTVDS